MWIYLARHGETNGNLNKIIQTPATPLSETGQRQVEQLAESYRQLPISLIITSDYVRTLQSAKPLYQRLSCNLLQSELLRERNFGDLRGKSYNDVPSEVFDPSYHPSGGESYPEFAYRVKKAYRLVLDLAREQTGDVMVMTHGLVLRCILSEILQLPQDMLSQVDIQNTSVTKISKTDPTNISMLCNVSHLHDAALQKRE